jgi:hypothetical protein
MYIDEYAYHEEKSSAMRGEEIRERESQKEMCKLV